jgi:hypothetical protein
VKGGILPSHSAVESTSVATLRGAIPVGQTPLGPTPTLTLFVHMHKGCTRDAHRSLPPDVPCRQKGGETGVPTGIGRSRHAWVDTPHYYRKPGGPTAPGRNRD